MHFVNLKIFPFLANPASGPSLLPGSNFNKVFFRSILNSLSSLHFCAFLYVPTVFIIFVIFTQSLYVSPCLCNLHFLSFNLNCKYTVLKIIFYSSRIFLHMAPSANLAVQHSQKSLFLSFYEVLSRLKELQGDCKALGEPQDYKTSTMDDKTTQKARL